MKRDMHKPGYVYLVDFGPVCKLGISTNHKTLAYRMTEYRLVYKNYTRNGVILSPPCLLHLIPVNDMRQSEVTIQKRWSEFHANGPLIGIEFYSLPHSAIIWFASLRTDPQSL